MSDLGCSCYIDDEGVEPSVIDEQIVTARARHACCECGDWIEPGQQYERVRGLWEGEWGTHATCMTCRTIRRAYCCTWAYGRLVETLSEALGFDYRRAPDEDEEDDRC